MKVNINKYQMGGGFTPFTPIFGQYVRGEETPQQESAKTKESSPKGIIDDGIYKELIGKGLNNEVNYFVEQLIKIEQAPGGLTLPENRSTALRVIAKINELQNNSEDWKKALSTAEKNEGFKKILETNLENFKVITTLNDDDLSNIEVVIFWHQFPQFLSSLPALKLVLICGSGIDHILKSYLIVQNLFQTINSIS